MKKMIFTFALCAATLAASAQSHDDLMRFSDYNWSYGTARSAAMGGAFVSLGADLSTMALNPAGLGMYRRSEIGLSPSFTSLRSTSLYRQDMPTGLQGIKSNMNRNRFALNNIGGAFNVYNGGGGVTSVTLGFGYNKLIDHNTRRDVRGSSGSSLSDYFAREMNGSGIAPDDVKGLIDRGGRDEYMPEMLAYQGYIIDYIDGDGYINRLSPEAYADFSQLTETEGSTGQFDLAAGMNFSNKFYLGFGFGIQDIYYKSYNSHYEEFMNTVLDHENSLRDLEYVERNEQRGTAWNFKVGAILRPVEALRIGVSFHTPTYITMDNEYRRQAFSRTGPDDDVWENESVENVLYHTYRARTPMRLMGGISYTFLDAAILSIDYERVWYDQMKLFNDFHNEDLYMTGEVQSIYKPADNLRVGLEANVAPGWFVRGGFAYYGGMYRDQVLIDEGIFKQYDGHSMNYSGGFGYRTAGWGVDLAYIYMDRRDLPRYTYSKAAAPYQLQMLRHNVTATFSVRF